MAKKKKHKFKHRNAAPRNAAPARVSAPRAPRAKAAEETATHRLGYTAAGAGSTALVGSLLARQGWAPKTIAGVLTAVGAGLAWKGDGATVRSLGAGTMSAAGSQLALLMMEDHDAKKPPSKTDSGKKPSNSDELPPGALESAFERARHRLALATGENGAID